MTNEDLIKLGFEAIPHPTIGNTVIYDIGRNRYLSASSMGSPNEMIFLCEHDERDVTKVTDVIVLHNYDYNGYITEERLKIFLQLKFNKKDE